MFLFPLQTDTGRWRVDVRGGQQQEHAAAGAEGAGVGPGHAARGRGGGAVGGEDGGRLAAAVPDRDLVLAVISGVVLLELGRDRDR